MHNLSNKVEGERARLCGLGHVSRPAPGHCDHKPRQGCLPLRRQGLALAKVKQHQCAILLHDFQICCHVMPCGSAMSSTRSFYVT